MRMRFAKAFMGLFISVAPLRAQFSLELGINWYDYFYGEFPYGGSLNPYGNDLFLEDKASPFIYGLNYQFSRNEVFANYYSAWLAADNSYNYSKNFFALGYRRLVHRWSFGTTLELSHFYMFDVYADHPAFDWGKSNELGIGVQIGYTWEQLTIRYRHEGLFVLDEPTTETNRARNAFSFTSAIPLDDKARANMKRPNPDHWLLPEMSMGLEIGLNELEKGGPIRLYPVWRIALVGGEEYQLAFSRSQWWSYGAFQSFISDTVNTADMSILEVGYRLEDKWDFWLGHSWNRKSYYLNFDKPEHRYHYERAISPAVGYRHNQFTFQLRADIKYQYEPQTEVFNRGDVRFGVLYRFK